MNFKGKYKPLASALFFLLALVTSYIRENVFLIINGVITGYGSYKANIDTPQMLSESYSLSQLNMLKWILTFLFSVVFMSITIGAVRFIFHNKSYNRMLLILYTTLCTSALLLLFAGILAGSYQHFFKQVRAIFGFIQSPVIPLLAVCVCYTMDRLNGARK